MKKILMLLALATAALAQNAMVNRQTVQFNLTGGTSAPSSGACDAAAEMNRVYVRYGAPASYPTQIYLCKQTGTSTYAWEPIGYRVGTTAPAKCTVGDVFFDSDATAGQNIYGCTATDTWTLQSGGGGGSPAGSNKQVQYNSSGSFGAEAGFEYDPATNTLSVDKISLTGTASETVLTDISTPSAPGTAGQTAFYTKSGQLATRANGGSEVLYAHGNSSGEATKGVAGAYDATTWNGNSETPTKDAIRDKIESMGGGGGTYDATFATWGCYSTSTCAVAGAWQTALSGSTVAGIPFSGLKFPADATNRSAVLSWVMPAGVTSLTITVFGGADGFGDGSITASMGVAYSCVTLGSTDLTALSYTSIGTATVAATGGYKTVSSGNVTWSSGLCSSGQLTYLRFLMNQTEADSFVMTLVRINAN
jgi:hypothetical protein